MNLAELTALMRDFNSRLAYGSECIQWQDYVADVYRRLGVAPWVDNADTIDVPADMADYWQITINGYRG